MRSSPDLGRGVHRPVIGLLDRLGTGPDLHRALDAALAHAPRTVVVDLSGVDRVTSTTIDALLTIQERCAGRGVQVLLRRPTRRSLETLRRIGLMSRLGAEEPAASPVVADSPRSAGAAS